MTAFLIRYLVLFLGLCIAVRIYLASTLASTLSEVPLWVWASGALSDVLAAALPLALMALAMRVRGDVLRRALVAVVVLIMLLVVIAEIFYWGEFRSRLDRLVFHYLAYPVEVLVFLDEQFYLSWLLLPLLLLAYGIATWLRPPRASTGLLLLALTVAALVVLVVRQPVPSPSRYLNQMASNGYEGVLSAAMTDVAALNDLLPQEAAEPPAPDPSASRGLAGMHLVLIIEESMAGPNWWAPERRADTFPNLLALAQRGVLFEQAYATGTRTTRGMEALLNGFPPLPGISTTERAGFERLPSLARALRRNGYHTVFAYGGWPNFSNFTRYWRASGFQETTSRHDFGDEAFKTSWGVSDDDLFASALTLMDARTAEHEAVFMAMLTVSHHRPYELPPQSPFSGGRSAEQALRYADAALGRYFEAARKRPWFKDTLFVVAADHGPRIDGDALIPAGSYHVPLLLLAEGRLAPRVVSAAVSTLSVPRTLANLLELRHEQAFWGSDLLAASHGPLPVEHDYHVGWIVNGDLGVLTRDGQRFGWRMADGRNTEPAPVHGLAAYFQRAHAAFYGE